VLTLEGTNFGTGASPASSFVTVGSRPCSTVQGSWSHSRILCSLPAGEGVDVAVSINAGGQVSFPDPAATVPLLFTYLPPSLQLLSPSSGPTRGNTSLTIRGGNFGLSAPTVTVGGRACVLEGPHSHSEAVCIVGEGMGTDNPVLFSTPFYASVLATGVRLSYAYFAPIITSFFPASADTDGGDRPLTVTGDNFGTSAQVTVGGQDCPISFQSHQRLECLVPAGQGRSLPLTVRVPADSAGSQEARAAGSWDYNPPVLEALQPVRGPTEGGVPLTLIGSSMGRRGAVVTVGGRACSPLLSHTDGQIVCTLPEGSGQAEPVLLVLDGDPLLASSALPFQYDGPTITDVVVSPGLGAPTAGSVPVTLVGRNFQGDPGGSVLIDEKVCPVLIWNSTAITCELPEGQGQGLDVQVATPAGLSSVAPGLFSYDPPLILQLQGAPAGGFPTVGGTALTLEGRNFGSPSTGPAEVRVGERLCEVSAAPTRAHELVVCLLPPGQGDYSPA